MKKIHISNITEIRNDRIYYRDNDDVFFIELNSCANNFELANSILNKQELKVRCVGERFFGTYAYYELYTSDGHTQLYLELKNDTLKRVISKITGFNFNRKDFQQFYAVQKRLNENGWTTLDLS